MHHLFLHFRQPIVTSTMINMTLEHGISPVTPVGLAWFAGHLTKMGEMSDGFRYAKLAKTLMDRLGSTEISGNALANDPPIPYLLLIACWISHILTGNVIWITSDVLHFNEPMQSVNEYRLHGQDVVLSSGDGQNACVLRMM
jgi:hypothetical protein